jgi:hypothetical protein
METRYISLNCFFSPRTRNLSVKTCVIEIRQVRVGPIFRKCLTNAGASLSEKILQGQRVGDGSRFLRNRSLLTAVLLLVFGAALRHMPAYACSCIRGGGTFVMNRESDDKTLILPRDARGVLWWQEAYAQKGSFGVRLLSGVRERDLDFRVIEVKPDLLLIAPTDKLVPGNRYLFTYRGDSKQPRNVQEVEAVVENTAFAAIKDQFSCGSRSPAPHRLRFQAEVCAAGLRRSLATMCISVSRLRLNVGVLPYCLKRFLTANANGGQRLTCAETLLQDQVGGGMDVT